MDSHPPLLPFFFHKICFANLTHRVEASTLTLRMQRASLNLLSTFSKVTCPSSLHISRNKRTVIHPRASCPPKSFAISFYIKCRLAVLAAGVLRGSFLAALPILFRLSSYHFQCFCNSCGIITWKCWQLIPSIPPTCSCFHPSDSCCLSNRRTQQVAHHFGITDVGAMALHFRIPFSGSASGFRRNINFTIFQELDASSRPIKRSRKHLVIS